MKTKICVTCKIKKPLFEFCKNKQAKDGRYYQCKECQYNVHVVYYKKNRLKKLKYAKDYRQNHLDKIKIWLKDNKEKIKRQAKEHYLKNKETIDKRNRLWKKNNKNKIKNRYLITNYNISFNEYNKLFESQNGVCAICNKPETFRGNNKKIKFLAVDHNHQSGKVRGLLCMKCNILLGNCEENIIILQKTIEYLKQKEKENVN
jgi:hypothetical protein